MLEKDYTKGVDFEYLEAMEIQVRFYQPWQLGLFHENLEGKFMWYPFSGTLMFDPEDAPNYRVGKPGDFLGEKETTEKVHTKMLEKIEEQSERD